MWRYKPKIPFKDLQFDGLKLVKKQVKKYDIARAVIYCRVSGNRQVESWFGLEDQEARCREYCEKHGIEVIRVFVEKAESWNRLDRPVFDECIAYLKELNKRKLFVTHFVCRDLSRISRPSLENLWEAMFLEKKITDTGVEIVDLSGNNYNDTLEGMLLKNIIYSFAWYQRLDSGRSAHNSQRTRMLEWYRAQSGVPMWYKRITVSKKDYYDAPDGENSLIIKQWLELYGNDPTMNNTQLHEFMVKKWLKGNGKSKNQNQSPWRTIVDKMLEPTRLF